MNGKKLGVVVQRLVSSSNNITSESLKRFTEVDDSRVSVIMRQLAQLFTETYRHACVTD